MNHPTLAYFTIFLLNLNPQVTSLDINADIGNIVDEVNNKYNTFSLVEVVMSDLEDYMQGAYYELKKLLMKKIEQTGKLFAKSTVGKSGE